MKGEGSNTAYEGEKQIGLSHPFFRKKKSVKGQDLFD